MKGKGWVLCLCRSQLERKTDSRDHFYHQKGYIGINMISVTALIKEENDEEVFSI